MKMTDYPAINKFTEDHIMIVDGNGGTKKITIADAILAALHLTSPTNHRMVFRGKNLGPVVTTEQLAAIQAGTFEDLWLGDYWVINGVTWRIADFDYWYGKGDTKCTKHHLVIMPDTKLGNIQMNSASPATTAGGYIGSKAYTANLAAAKATATSAFGDAIITHREYFTNAVTSGRPSSGTWCDSTIDLPNEIMMYGHVHMGAVPSDNSSDIKNTIDSTQLALFQVRPEFITTVSTWLRDVVNDKKFAVSHDSGMVYACNADYNSDVRPVFAIG